MELFWTSHSARRALYRELISLHGFYSPTDRFAINAIQRARYLFVFSEVRLSLIFLTP